MTLSEDIYVPTLRWRMGEYQALMRLRDTVKDHVVPLICIPEVEFDFDLRQPKKTVHEHILPFVSRYKTKWGERPAWITLNQAIALGRMNDGKHVFDYIFEGLRINEAQAIPTMSLSIDRDSIEAVARAAQYDNRGVGIILRLEDLMAVGSRTKAVRLAEAVSVRLNETDIIIDLRAPNFEPYSTFATALIAAMHRMGNMSVFRNLIIISTAIPDSFKDIAKGTDEIPRHDWLFYQVLLTMLPDGMRRPIYGDYTVVHPDFVALDMRKIKSAGKVIYTTPDTWGTRKGGAFRGNEAQMHSHCNEIISDARFQFQGSTFSYGDDYIFECAKGRKGPSNLTRWKDVAINHHITMVATDLAKLVAAS